MNGNRTSSCAAVLLALAAFGQFSPLRAQDAASAPDRETLTLLGVAGGPPPHANESQPGNLLVVDGKNYLIDAGENVGQQLLRAGSGSEKLDAVFITHMHWDHTLGMDYLMAVGWMMGRRKPLPIYGPPGLEYFLSRVIAAVEVSEDLFRAQSPNNPKLDQLYPIHEADIDGPTKIYSDGHVAVTAVANAHYGADDKRGHAYGPEKSYSYRFDSAHGSVTFTGDTGPSPEVEELAKGSDVLVSEIVDLDSIREALIKNGMSGKQLEAVLLHMRQQHLAPDEVGKLAESAGVRELVLTHHVDGPGFNPDDFAAKVRPYFPDGKIVVGHDLDKIEIGIR